MLNCSVASWLNKADTLGLAAYTPYGYLTLFYYGLSKTFSRSELQPLFIQAGLTLSQNCIGFFLCMVLKQEQ
jgi:hypothetical protein